MEQLEAERAARIEELRQSEQEAARLSERVESLKTQVDEQAKGVRLLEGQRDEARGEAKAAAGEVARLTEREKALSTKVAEQAAQLADQQKQLTTEFENIATRVLKANALELSDGSQKALAAILDPLRERIQDFQKKVETAYESETREVLCLKEQIRLVATRAMRSAARRMVSPRRYAAIHNYAADGASWRSSASSRLQALPRAGSTSCKGGAWGSRAIPAEFRNPMSSSSFLRAGR